MTTEQARAKQREYSRRFYEKNRAKENERNRRYHSENQDKIRSRKQEYRAENREAERERFRRWESKNRKNRNEYQRRRRRGGYRPPVMRSRQVITAELWHAQEGRCYLCGDNIALEKSHLDHDHRCCPPYKFCSFCIRGVACGACNVSIGFLQDDPARLERVAENLRIKLAEIDDRLAAKPVQGTFEEIS